VPETPGPASATVRWLAPEEVRARWEPDAARLCIRIGGGEEVVDARVALAFPVSAPRKFIDLAGPKSESLGMLRSLEGMDAESRKAITAALEARYLIPQIRRLLELEEVVPLVIRWRVETDRGERTFHTESPREAVRYQDPDGIRVTDLAGNHYDLSAMSELDPASRALLSSIL
jgi:hypothetical protein